MSDQRPISFENYPGDPASGTGGQFPDPTVSDTPPAPLDLRPGAWTPAPAPAKTNRRAFVGMLLGVAAAGVGVSLLARSGTAITETEGEATAGAETGQLVVGDYSADLPDGWTIDEAEDDLAVATAGTNRVLACTFTASGTAGEIILAEVKSRIGDFTGDFSDLHTTTDASSDYDNAGVTVKGKVGDRTARLTAGLWIDDSSDGALLVIQTVTAKDGSDWAVEAQGIADQLSEYFS